ncbi:MAG: glycosyl hydrolase [Chloroflexota bacterium]
MSKFEGLLKWRCIGPFRGGRVVAVAGDTKNHNTFYFGACAGGIWKTEDAGTYWECISDGQLKTSSVGALTVSASDPNVIYAGMGETTIRIDVSHGDGVYKSTDAGKTWTSMGLEDTRHIAEIVVHPTNPDIVYVAAFGHAFGPHPDRGVYKSTDGGETWRKVLFRSEKAGAIDITMDPNNPRILYAAIWEAYRSFSQISSGGPDSSIYKSTDGGETWTELTSNPGLPKGTLGKIGVAASTQPGRVWALIEHKEGGMYRSEDYGETWTQVSGDMNLVSRAWYYVHVHADPVDGNTVYVNNLNLWKSIDGGNTYDQITTPHGDNHDIWINPANTQIMVQGNDGGANVTQNGGKSWSSIYNQPTAQFYHLDVSNDDPYKVYGTQQDNSSIAVPSRSNGRSITWADCHLAGSGESGYIAVNPDDPDIVFVGAIGSSPGGGNALQRYDHRSKQIRLVTTWPVGMRGYGGESHKYRFAWTYPIIYSPHDSNTIYIGGNQVFKTNDEGQSWEAVSPDLTRADPDTLKPTGGPINKDSLGAEIYATVFALAESPHQQGVLWAGSDDGYLHMTHDGGENWHNLTPDEWPEWLMISMIEPSPHNPSTIYVAGTRYKLDDYKPYIYKTNNNGETWEQITDGIPVDDFTRVIREDPNREGLLYAGTETGLYVSFNGGDSWERFQLNLPVSPIHDLKVKNGDLVVATHGRSFWILDDLTPLYQYSDSIADKDAHLFKPRSSVRVLPKIFEGFSRGIVGKKSYMSTLGIVAAFTQTKTKEGALEAAFHDSGENPPREAIITYHLKEGGGEMKLSFSDMDGNVIREIAGYQEPSDNKKEADDALKASNEAGWNRFLWDMRHEPVTSIKGTDPVAQQAIEGAMVVPGTYQVTLTVGEESMSESFEIIQEPGTTGSQADLQEQYQLWVTINEKLDEAAQAINQMRDLREQLAGWADRAGDEALCKQAADLKEKVLEIESSLTVPDLRPGWPDGINAGWRLFDQLKGLPAAINLGDYKPTDQAHEVYADLAGKIDEKLAELSAFLDNELAAFNADMSEMAAVVPQ